MMPITKYRCVQRWLNNKTRTDYSRVEQLWQRSQAVAKAEVDKQRTAMDVAQADYALAKKDFDDTRLVAPFSGVITKRYVENYSNVKDKEPIVSLQDLNDLEIMINVPERVVRNTPKKVVGYAVFAFLGVFYSVSFLMMNCISTILFA